MIHLGDAGGARIPDIMGATDMMSMVYRILGAPRDRRVSMIVTIMGECYAHEPTHGRAEAGMVSSSTRTRPRLHERLTATQPRISWPRCCSSWSCGSRPSPGRGLC